MTAATRVPGTRHVVLVTYGEPTRPSFADQLAYSWRILVGLTRKVDAIPRPLLPIIALARARGRRALWRQYDYASPLEPITEQQARGVADRLSRLAPRDRWQVHVAYEYRQPLVGDLVGSLPEDEPVWVVPLYAAESAFTHALTREATAGRRGPVFVLGAFAADVLAHVSAAHVLAHTSDEPGWRGNDVALVLAAHGTVLEPPKPLDTGRESTEALCSAIAARLAPHFGMVVNGWLNHTRGGRWTEPPIEEALADVVKAGYKRIVYYPYGFLADNAESQLEGRVALEGLANGAGAGLRVQAKQLPCFNDGTALLDLLTRQVLTCVASCAPGERTGVSSVPAGNVPCYRLCQPNPPAARDGACALCAAPQVADAQPHADHPALAAS